MTSTPALPPTDDDLNAYADGQLARRPRGRGRARRSRATRRCRARRRHPRAERGAARRARPDARRADSRAPARGRAGAARVARRHRVRAGWQPAFAAAATLVLGVGARLVRPRGHARARRHADDLRPRRRRSRTRSTAADQRRPVEVWANEEKGLVTWLTRRLGVQAHAPGPQRGRLRAGRRPAGRRQREAHGAAHVRERRQAAADAAVAQDRRPAPARPRSATRSRTASACSTGSTTTARYALSGNLDRTQLLAVARVVYGQLAAAEAARLADLEPESRVDRLSGMRSDAELGGLTPIPDRDVAPLSPHAARLTEVESALLSGDGATTARPPRRSRSTPSTRRRWCSISTAFERNLDLMANAVRGAGLRAAAARQGAQVPGHRAAQIARGAVGICCQKVDEAAAFVDAGIRDVLVTNEVVGRAKLARLAALAQRATRRRARRRRGDRGAHRRARRARPA